MRYIPTNGESPDELIDPRRRMFAGMFNAPQQMSMGDQSPIMMDAPEIGPDAQTLFLRQRDEDKDEEGGTAGRTVPQPEKPEPVPEGRWAPVPETGKTATAKAAPIASVGGAATGSSVNRPLVQQIFSRLKGA